MNRTINKILLLGAITMFLFSCSSTDKATSSSKQTAAPKENSKAALPLKEDDRINLLFVFMNANKEKMLGNKEKAAELFAQAIRIDGRNDAAMYELAKIYVEEKKYNDALFFAKSAATINSKNEWYQMLLADVYQRTGKWNDAIEIYQNLVKNYPNRIDYYFELASAQLFAGKSGDALKTYDNVEKEIGIDKELIVQKEHLYLKLGKVDKAAAELEKLIAKFPNDLEGYSMLVELYQANGMKDKGFETIQRMQKVNPNSPYVFMALAEYFRSTGEKEKSFEQLKLAFASKDLDSDIKLKVLMSYLNVVKDNPDMMTQALELSKTLSETHPTEANPQAVYGDFLSMDKKYEDAQKQYHAAIAIDKKNIVVWQQLL